MFGMEMILTLQSFKKNQGIPVIFGYPVYITLYITLLDKSIGLDGT